MPQLASGARGANAEAIAGGGSCTPQHVIFSLTCFNGSLGPSGEDPNSSIWPPWNLITQAPRMTCNSLNSQPLGAFLCAASAWNVLPLRPLIQDSAQVSSPSGRCPRSPGSLCIPLLKHSTHSISNAHQDSATCRAQIGLRALAALAD